METALQAAATSAVPRLDRTGRGLSILAIATMLERMGYYGMRALLVLYMIDKTRGGLGWDQQTALHVYGLFTGAIFLTPLLGAIVADKVLGQRRAVGVGALLIMLGLLVLTIPANAALYLALTLVAIGTGLFKPAVYTMVGGLYDRQDHRRDGAFTLFLMPINVGAFLAPLVCGTLGEKFGWTWGFGAAAASLVLGLILLWANKDSLRGKLWAQSEFAADPSAASKPRSREGKDHLKVLVVLAVIVGVFALLTEIVGSAQESPVDQQPGIGSFLLAGGAGAFAFILSPLFAWLWTSLGRNGRDLLAPQKMALGMAVSTAGLLLVAVANRSGPEMSQLSAAVVLGILLQAAGLLCLEPIALSTVTRLAPARYIALSVAAWWLVTSLPSRLSEVAGSLVERLGTGGAMAIIAAGFIPAVVLILISPTLRSRTHV